MMKAPLVRSICLAGVLCCAMAGLPQSSSITVYLVGDSTMSEKVPEKRPETGWGMPFAELFDEGVTVENHARNGRSTKTFLEEGRWQVVYDKVAPGDYVFIQFGHNDEGEHKAAYTPPEDYRRNLIRFVTDARAKEATPILLTPVTRRQFDESGSVRDTHPVYSDIVRDVARRHEVHFIDMDRKSQLLLEAYGEEPSRKLFLQLEPGEHPNYPEGVVDNTHFNEYGAQEMAGLVVEALEALQVPLADRVARGAAVSRD